MQILQLLRIWMTRVQNSFRRHGNLLTFWRAPQGPQRLLKGPLTCLDSRQLFRIHDPQRPPRDPQRHQQSTNNDVTRSHFYNLFVSFRWYVGVCFPPSRPQPPKQKQRKTKLWPHIPVQSTYPWCGGPRQAKGGSKLLRLGSEEEERKKGKFEDMQIWRKRGVRHGL